MSDFGAGWHGACIANLPDPHRRLYTFTIRAFTFHDFPLTNS
jgi:hypothetical protein